MGGEHYKPSRAVLERLKKVHFVAVVGPTASGKTTLINGAVTRDSSLHRVMNNTSRAMRDGEQEGVEYYFHTREEMIDRMGRGEYVQVAPTVLGDIYATAPENYNIHGISLLPVLTDALPQFKALPFASFSTVFVLPEEYDIWVARIKHHAFSAEQKAKRLAEAAHALRSVLDNPDALFVISGAIEPAIKDFMDRVRGQPLTADEQREQKRARVIAQDLLRQLEADIY